jgi:hypothetical protein
MDHRWFFSKEKCKGGAWSIQSKKKIWKLEAFRKEVAGDLMYICGSIA